MTVKVQQFEMMTHAIQFAVQSHQITGQNLANVNTPGYKAKEVPFQELLDRVEGKSANPTADFQVDVASERTMRNDGNTVDLDRENLRHSKKMHSLFKPSLNCSVPKWEFSSKPSTGNRPTKE